LKRAIERIPEIRRDSGDVNVPGSAGE